jgi:hypothetical protein
MNRIPMRGELRRHFSVDLLQSRIGVARVQIVERALGAIEQTASALQRNDCVLECWLFGIVRHHFNFFEFFVHAFLHRRREVFVLDPVEWRNVIWQRAFREQWVVFNVRILHA